MDQIRVGKISSLNYEKGLAKITYSDRDDAVTKEVPVLTPYGEYYMPEVDDYVYMMHLPNGSEAAVIMGRYWTKNYTPPEGFQGLRRKDLSRSQGKCYWRYDDPEVGDGNEGVLKFHNDDDVKIDIDGDTTVESEGKIDVSSQDNISVKSDGTLKVEGANKVEVKSDGTIEITGSGTVKITGATIDITGSSGDVKVQGISLTTHTHNCTAPGAPSGVPIPT